MMVSDGYPKASGTMKVLVVVASDANGGSSHSGVRCHVLPSQMVAPGVMNA